MRQLNANDGTNSLVKHRQTDHSTHKKVTFAFEPLQKFKDPLTRHAEEGVRIEAQSKLSKILNTKSEFNHPPISRVKVVRK